jgi:hypothetical protein
MVNVEGVQIQAVAFPEVAPGIVSAMINPRVFAQFVGATSDWDDASRTFTFTGTSVLGAPVTVSLTLGSPNVTINGQSFDIAVAAGQTALVGKVMPQVVNDRQYVPARILANAFGIPVDFVGGSLVLG